MSVKKFVSLLLLSLLILLPLLGDVASATGHATVNFVAGEMKFGDSYFEINFGDRLTVPTAATSFPAKNTGDIYLGVNNLTPWVDWQVKLELTQFNPTGTGNLDGQFYGVLALRDGHCTVTEGTVDRTYPNVLDVDVVTQAYPNNPQVVIVNAVGVPRGSYKINWDSISLKVNDEQALKVTPYINYTATMYTYVARTP